jgi:hypothetical protein
MAETSPINAPNKPEIIPGSLMRTALAPARREAAQDPQTNVKPTTERNA